MTQASTRTTPLHPRPAGLDELVRAAAATDIEPALTALVALQPHSAAGWLLDNEEAVREALPGQRLAALLGGLLERCDPTELLELAKRYADALPAPAAARWLARCDSRSEGAQRVLASLLERQSRSPELLRLAADWAVQRGAADAHELLTRLGQADPRLTTLNHISRQRKRLPVRGLPTVRAALLSSYTIDPLVPYLEQQCAELGLDPEFYLTPFNSWAQEAVVSSSALYAFEPEVAFVALALDDLVPELAANPSAPRLRELGAEAVDRVCDVVERLASQSNALIVVHGFYTAYRTPTGIVQGEGVVPRTRWVAELNAQLADRLRPLAKVRVLDVQEALIHRVSGGLDNPKMRHYASMRLSEQALAEIARLSAGYMAALKGLTRKCVVLDLDNTLWGGIVGEDGPAGIRLGNTAPGSEFYEFQQYLQSLTSRGILLAINSKNNPDDAHEALRENEWMVLRKDAFSAIRMNWQPKPENMREIARELNIGLDSLVFIDDNPKERELMRQMLPEVLTPEMPADPALYRQVIESLPQLQALAVTEEDRKRVQLYRAQRERAEQRSSAASLEEYLQSLDIRIGIGPATEQTLPRIHQLFQRTNQFNLTTRRHSIEELRAAMGRADARLYGLTAADRFGHHGLVATALVLVEGEDWCIDSLLMSCRVIGYGVETALLAHIAGEAAGGGAARLIGEIIPTPKNVPARDLYERHGFSLLREDGDAGAAWALDLNQQHIEVPQWIAREEGQA